MANSTTTMRLVKKHCEVGPYKETCVDKRKKDAAFRIIQTNPYIIAWKNGETEKVSAKKLKYLQANYTWAPDF